MVSGDDLSGPEHRELLRRELGSSFDRVEVVSANAYLGAEPIAAALRAGADIVVCGRVADPSLVVGPAMAHFDFAPDDWERLGRATMAGHLLECGAQVTGGYFADPGVKDVPGLERVGFPIAEIGADGACTVTKAADTGGCVTVQTVKEQLLYEVHDPAAYLTPDVTADISDAEVKRVGHDRVAALGRARASRARSASRSRCATKAAGSPKVRSRTRGRGRRRARASRATCWRSGSKASRCAST